MATNDPFCSYVNPKGDFIDLADNVNFITLSFGGIGVPPPEHQGRDLPLRDGSTYIYSRYAARMLTVFLIIKGTDFASRRGAERHAAQVLSPGVTSRSATTGTLTLSNGDGTVRAVDCVYSGGLEYGPDGRLGPAARRVALSFLCPSVFFRSTDYTTVAFAAASGSAPKVNTAYTFQYQGTAPAYPIVTLTGPASNPYLQHTGPESVVRTVGLTYALASSNTIEFDAGIKKKTIRLNPTGTPVDLSGYCQPVSGINTEWFEFLPGSNTLLVKDQAGSPTMTAALKYYEQFEAL